MIYTPSVQTTFLPKNNQLDPKERGYVRAGKGRVFGTKPENGPKPPAPPYEALAVATKAKNNDGNVYEIGEMVAFTTATYTGGTADSNQYRWRIQERDHADDSWVNGTWTTYDNTATSIVKDLRKGGQVRFQCQARDTSQDPVPQVNSFGPVATVPFPPLVVQAPVLTGQPYVGETLTCTQPTVTGGRPDYTYSYMWLDSNAKSPSNEATVLEYDLGKMMSCYVPVTDSQGNQASAESNKIGPIEQYTIGEVELKNSNTDTIIENGDIDAIMQGASVTYVADYDGSLPQDHALWSWTVRSGNVTIRGSSNLPYCTFELPNEFPGSCSLSVAIGGKGGEDYTNDNSTVLWNIAYTE